LLEALGMAERISPPARFASTTTLLPPPSKRCRAPAFPVAAVSTGFPAGLSPHHLKVQEIKESVADGAQ
jgi:deoxyribose-phosphate aldolase